MRSNGESRPKIVCALLALLAARPAVQAYSQEPNNAALLYKQAFISLPQGNDQMERAVSTLPDGVDPNNRIREYLRQCEPAINLAVAASEIMPCDWGLQYFQGSRMTMPHLAQIRTLARLMKAHVAVLEADGQYRQALEHGLTVRRMARHVGDEIPISLLVSRAIDTLANRALQDTLDTAPPDEKTMAWLRQPWAAMPGEDRQFVNAVKGEQKLSSAEMDKDPFTGQDFRYEKTPEGFILTRWIDSQATDKTYRHTFKVK